MIPRTTLAIAVLASSVLAQPSAARGADDPLQAFPTPENPVEKRVQRLTKAQLQAIEVPRDENRVVFSYATTPPDGGAAKPNADERLLRVYADGRIDCGLRHPADSRHSDKLSDAELKWLLHLAVNECRVHSRTTKEIDDAYWLKRGDRPPKFGYVEYHVSLASGDNDLRMPADVLIERFFRAELKLGAFASLNKYATYLANRAQLGPPAEREALLKQLNAIIAEKKPTLPAFRMEHLAGVSRTDVFGFIVAFEQTLDLGDGRFKRVTGSIIQRDPESELEFLAGAMEYTKYRP